jgi:hypothetical protein
VVRLAGYPSAETITQLRADAPSAGTLEWVAVGSVPAAGGVTSVNGATGVVVLAKADIGLGNADNTSDANKPVSTAQQTALDARPLRAFTKRTITADYSVVLADATDITLHSTAASAVAITLPSDATAAIAQENPIPWRQYGAGQITFVAGSGATIISRGNFVKSTGQYAEGIATKVAANTWLLSGDLM